MSDPLDRIETEVTHLAQQQKWEQDNRLALLWVHATVGVTAGVQMFLWGSATTIEDSVGLWARLVLAIMGTLGGSVLAVGLRHKPRSIRLEAAGLFLVGIWDGLMSAGLIYARVHQHDYALRPLFHHLPEGYVVAYPVSLYLGMLALISIHLGTLRKLVKLRRLRR